jgi:hypothetical protein
MTTKTFNAIEYINGALQAGFTRDQAEFQANSIMNTTNELVTKDFFREVLANEFKLFEQKMTIKLGLMMLGMVGVLTFLLKHT